MDIFVWLIVIGVLVSVGGWVVWFVFWVWLAKKVISVVEREFINNMNQAENLISQISRMNPGQIPTQQENQILQMLLQTQSQWSQLDSLAQQRYDTKMGDLMGMAASAGIDWKPY